MKHHSILHILTLMFYCIDLLEAGYALDDDFYEINEKVNEE